ncbi:glycosylase [Deltaproteobacteria bacterium]|nr:glycosylase [Deltaproteobacteria bacterium]
MKWNKKGPIFKLRRGKDWMNSHAQCPLPLLLEDKIRIYFSTRLENQQSLPVYIDVKRDAPDRILHFQTEPILERGRPGTFDENGLIPNSLLRVNNSIYLYYAGWSQAKTVPYKNFTGLAVSNDNGDTFTKISEAPVFTLNEFDPLSATGPLVVPINGAYWAIYSTGTKWHEIEGHLEHTYLFTCATSNDAIHWRPSGKIIVAPNDEYEAMCKPAIIKLGDIYHMWFSVRGSHGFRKPGQTAYRLGYAWSKDLLNWNRDDVQAGIDISESGWDSEMICYPSIIEVEGKYLMFYNGNGFGKEGFGYAELDI